jgi:Sulfotransferase domain
MESNLRVIGAGLGRTGTTSLKNALEILLSGKCFHALEYKHRPQLMSRWLSFTRDFSTTGQESSCPNVPRKAWQHLMPGYVACVDEPASLYWRQLAETYGDAVIILSIRESADIWWESTLDVMTQLKEERSRAVSQEREAFFDFGDALFPHFKSLSEKNLKERYEKHNNSVIDFVRNNTLFNKRFLIWQAEQGWEPICRLLKVDIPDIQFPHVNKRHEYHGY